MGWLTQKDFDDVKAAALRLTESERLSLTWKDARKFVLLDTLELATWAGLEELGKSGLTPWEAVCQLRRIEGFELVTEDYVRSLGWTMRVDGLSDKSGTLFLDEFGTITVVEGKCRNATKQDLQHLCTILDIELKEKKS